MNIREEISKLKEVAKKNGLEVKFRDHKTNQGDFCLSVKLMRLALMEIGRVTQLILAFV